VKSVISVGESWKTKVLWMAKALHQMGFGRTSYFEEVSRQMISEFHFKLASELPPNGQVFDGNCRKCPLNPAVIMWRLMIGSQTPEDDGDCEDFLSANDRWINVGIFGEGLLLIAPFLKYFIPGITGYTAQMELLSVVRGIAQVIAAEIQVVQYYVVGKKE